MSIQNQNLALKTLKQGCQAWDDAAIEGPDLIELLEHTPLKQLKLIPTKHLNRYYRVNKNGVEVLSTPLEFLINLEAYAAADKLLEITTTSIKFLTPFKPPELFEKASQYLKHLAKCGRDLYLTLKQTDPAILDKTDENNCTIFDYISFSSSSTTKLKKWVAATMHVPVSSHQRSF